MVGAAGGGGDTLFGGSGNGTLNGGGGNDVLAAGVKNDSLDGGGGNDFLLGDAGADVLGGGSGADSLFDGAGKEATTGGSGADLCDFGHLSEISTANGPDVVTDFTTGVAQISFVGLALTLVTGAFTGGVNQIRCDSATSTLQIDQNADAIADLQIDLNGIGAAFDAVTDLIL